MNGNGKVGRQHDDGKARNSAEATIERHTYVFVHVYLVDRSRLHYEGWMDLSSKVTWSCCGSDFTQLVSLRRVDIHLSK